MDKNEREFLEHFGILGMHWGHHKVETTGGEQTKSKKEVMAEQIIGRPLKPSDFNGFPITKKGALSVRQYDDQGKAYNKVKKEGDPLHALVSSENSRKGVARIIKGMEDGRTYNSVAKQEKVIRIGKAATTVFLGAYGFMRLSKLTLKIPA